MKKKILLRHITLTLTVVKEIYIFNSLEQGQRDYAKQELMKKHTF
jgi:hypothetical protein